MPRPFPFRSACNAAVALFALSGAAFGAHSAAAQSTLTIPTGTGGTTTSNYPLNTSGERIQLFYGSSFFTGVTGPISISAITFQGSTTGSTKSSTLTLYVGSSTITSVSGVSQTYQTNDNASTYITEFNNQTYDFTNNSTSTTATIVLPTPVVYNPTSGQSFFIDMSSASYGFFTSTDLLNSGSQLFARNYGTNVSTTASTVPDNSRINVLSITYTAAAAPEPSAFALAALPFLGIAGKAVYRRRAARA